jgi:hypothetical protein
MGLRFRKSIRLAPGVRVNLGLKGSSVSVGPRGASTNISRRGVRSTVSLPGTGLSYTTPYARPSGTTAPRLLRGLLMIAAAIAILWLIL